MKKNKYHFKQTEIRCCIVLVMLIPVWIGLAPVCYDWFSEKGNGILLKSLYTILDGLWLVNIPIAIALGYLFFIWFKRFLNDQTFRFFRPILAIIGLMLLLVNGERVNYAKVVWKMDYRMFFTVFLIVSLLLMCFKGIRCLAIRKKSEKRKEKIEPHLGFSDDNGGKKNCPENLKTYADEIIERVLATNIKKQSYAIGVTGEWGVGKTSFLDVLEEKIGNRAEIVKFNPWMCSTPEQVTHDFFASLRHQLSSTYSSLSRSIREYAKYVSSLSLTSGNVVSMDLLLSAKQESLFERKKSLSEKFSLLSKPVVVIIDDVDRLERDEVFEVLRLIRNTADLSNTIYLVAYDKEYVTSVLKEKEIKDSTAYLEKIFQVEVHLPKVEEQLIWNTLIDEIEAQNSFGRGFAKKMLEQFNPDEQELILDILDNYRRVKRFARLFTLNIAYLWRQAKMEVKFSDVFWLELLQIYDKRTYTVLADEPDRLLYRDNGRFRLRDGVLISANEKDQNKFNGEPFWEKDTIRILDLLFGNYISTKKQSVCFTENYSKYFMMSVSPFRLSISEMSQLFDEKVNPEELVGRWLDSRKYFSSIAYQFKQIEPNKLKDDELEAFLHGVLAFGIRVSPYRHSHIWEMKQVLYQEHYDTKSLSRVHDIVMDWFAKKLKEKKWLLYEVRLLQLLYETETYDEDGRKEEMNPLVISNQEVEGLLAKVTESYLDKHPELSALDLIKDSGGLHYLFKNCCVTVKDKMIVENWCEYKQVAFDAVIAHFSKKEIKPTLAEYNEAYGKMFEEKVPDFDNPQDEFNYWEYRGEEFDHKMQEYFGSLYDDKQNSPLDEFKVKCFVKEKQAVKANPKEKKVTNVNPAIVSNNFEKKKTIKKEIKRQKKGKK